MLNFLGWVLFVLCAVILCALIFMDPVSFEQDGSFSLAVATVGSETNWFLARLMTLFRFYFKSNLKIVKWAITILGFIFLPQWFGEHHAVLVIFIIGFVVLNVISFFIHSSDILDHIG